MRKLRVLAGSLALATAIVSAVPASAQIVVDGVRDARYGAVDSTVTFVPGTPQGNFGTPTPFSDSTNYTISLEGGTNSVFGFLQSDRNTGLPFANLYFGLNGGGSNLGFEIGANGVNAFIPSNGSRVTLNSSQYSTFFSTDNTTIEFALANSLFTSPIAGLNYASGQVFPTTGSNVRLNLSQSFGYSVAGGATYGGNRLAAVTLGGAPTAAVPEPASWAMMVGGIGVIGGTLRRRRRSAGKLAGAGKLATA